MKYYLDTEFLEGPQKEKFPISLFRKNTPPTIDLISIGIVAEDGREYYAISKDFNMEEAWNRYDLKQAHTSENHSMNDIKVYWIRENVLKPIWREIFFQADDSVALSNKQTEEFHRRVFSGEYDHWFNFKSMKLFIDKYGKTNKQIAKEVRSFCSMGSAYSTMDKTIASIMYFSELDSEVQKTIEDKKLIHVFNEKPEFYAYYADYDWVVFCWLFGKMMDLPNEFPMYCRDLKQVLDEEIDRINYIPRLMSPNCPLVTCESMKENNPRFPKQDTSKSHNAIEDARWNKQLHDFLKNI